MMAKTRKLYLFLALVVLIGCSGNDIRLFIYSDAEFEISGLAITVERGEENKVDAQFASGDYVLPTSFTLEDGENGAGEKITVHVHAYGTSGFEVDRIARLDFDPERDVVLPVPLCAACDGVTCEADQTCKAGVCAGVKVDETELPEAGDDVPQSECGGGGAGGGGGGGSVCTSRCGTSEACGACPTVATVSPGSFTIDVTEVTRADYQAWLATSPRPETVHPDCDGITDFSPNPADEDSACTGDCASHPQVGVVWCGAWQYCDWAGKRLCSIHKITASDPEWEVACRGAGTAYPYGDTYQASTCNGTDAAFGGTWPVGSNPTCVSAEGVFDLSGNVAEWTAECSTGACTYRGGSFASPGTQMTCTSRFSGSIDGPSPNIGFRCCGD